MRNAGGLLLVVAVVALAVPAPARSNLVQDVRTMKALVNAARAQHGLRPLRISPCQGQPKSAPLSAVEKCTIWRRVDSPATTAGAVGGAPVASNFAPTDENAPILGKTRFGLLP